MQKFKIPETKPTSCKTIRFPREVERQVKAALRGRRCSFFAFVVEAVRVALENLKENSTPFNGSKK